MAPYVPRYVSPKERAEGRARMIRFSYWMVVGIPVFVALMMFGYSDQAPQWLRSATASVDAMLGMPVLWLVTKFAAT